MKYLSPALLLALAIGVTASGATNEPKANLDELLHAISTLTADVTQLIVESDAFFFQPFDDLLVSLADALRRRLQEQGTLE